ncbi:MAG: hypothetical protein ACREQI_00515 [Candidatus Binataceae bacterium]
MPQWVRFLIFVFQISASFLEKALKMPENFDHKLGSFGKFLFFFAVSNRSTLLGRRHFLGAARPADGVAVIMGPILHRFPSQHYG